LKAFEGAKETWEAVRNNDPNDLEANLLLGTIYERLGDLTRSTQALERALDNTDLEKNDRAEASSLLARNAKTRWRVEWKDVPVDERSAQALRSPRLKDSYENYSRAFDEDLNHYYSGLNALAMLTIMVELGAALPKVWGEPFESDEKAALELASYKEQAQKLAAAVDLSLRATRDRLKRDDKTDVWAEISYADLLCITSKRPQRVAAAYRDAIKDVADFDFDSVRKQLLIYKQLGLVEANLAEAVKVVGSLEEAGGGGGRGIFSPEGCARMGVPSLVYPAIPPGRSVVSSVQKTAGRGGERFLKLYNKQSEQKRVRVLSEATDVVNEREYLPAWLRSKPDYGIWQRNNLWTLFNALAEGGARNLTLIALWDGEPTGDGPGGTSDLV